MLLINADIVMLANIAESTLALEPADVLPKCALAELVGFEPVLPFLTHLYVPIGAPFDDSTVVVELAVTACSFLPQAPDTDM